MTRREGGRFLWLALCGGKLERVGESGVRVRVKRRVSCKGIASLLVGSGFGADGDLEGLVLQFHDAILSQKDGFLQRGEGGREIETLREAFYVDDWGEGRRETH